MAEKEQPGSVPADRKIGFREAVSIGVGGVVGAGIFVLSGTASAEAGPAVIISFLLAFVASATLALCFAELSTMHGESGGQYAYAKAHLPPLVATIVGWANLGAWTSGAAFVGRGFGEHLHLLVPMIPSVLGASVLTVILVTVNLFGLRVSGRTQFVIMLVEVLFLVSFITFAGIHIDPQRFSPFFAHGVLGVLQAGVVGFIALLGWDAVVVAAEEIDQPQRTIPRAVFASLGIVFVLYVGLLVVINGVLPTASLNGTATPVADAAAAILGPVGRTIVNIIIVVALTATVNAFIVVISRAAFVLARDHRAPGVLARTSSSGAPWGAIIFAGVAQIIMTNLSDLSIAVSATGFLYTTTSVASIWALFACRRKGQTGSFATPFYPVLPVVALGLCFGFIVGSGVRGALIGIAWLTFGTICSAVMKRRTANIAGRGQPGHHHSAV